MNVRRQRPPSLLCSILEACSTRLVYGKPLKNVDDASLISATSDLCKRFRAMENLRTADLQKDTADTVLQQALETGLQIGIDWALGADPSDPYDDVLCEEQLATRVVADVLPELISRLYLSELLGPQPTVKEAVCTG